VEQTLNVFGIQQLIVVETMDANLMVLILFVMLDQSVIGIIQSAGTIHAKSRIKLHVEQMLHAHGPKLRQLAKETNAA
jgi:hypothetical protein